MIYRFGVFEFDGESKELRKNGRAAALEPQPAKALALLLSRPGDVVTREELRDAVWGKGTHVDFDRGLAYCVRRFALRSATAATIRDLSRPCPSADSSSLRLSRVNDRRVQRA